MRLLDVDLQPLSEAETIDAVLAASARGQGGWVCPVNLDVLRQASASPDLRALVESADLRVADGMPLIAASRLLGEPLPERVAGSSLVVTLSEAAARCGARVFLLGGAPGVVVGAARELRRRVPELVLSGTLSPPLGFEHRSDDMDAIERALEASQPDLVFVGLGFPKQERLIQHLRARFPNAWFVSCGVSFSFLSGDRARAPRWMQRAGLEWLHRLRDEPRRLFKRYIVLGVPFALRLLAHVGARRALPRVP